ncbi:membrane-associated protein, putative [Bodo saltans]|uniref:Membrane-associated protein, putative n=1 Tax=Bodo saltans TaxID=75058 RepID=A0A0S4JSG4_BODSA|nr:membrane-associated protein, putative [Bodo saltans]|eukprot:CUG93304.1 membrane-associated protein, putative [Bodo saltans]
MLSITDLLLAICLSAATGLGVGTKGASCSVMPLVVAVVYLSCALVHIVLRPHRKPIDTIIFPVVWALFGALCIFKYLNSADALVDNMQLGLSGLQLFQTACALLVFLRERQWRAQVRLVVGDKGEDLTKMMMLELDDPYGELWSKPPSSRSSSRSSDMCNDDDGWGNEKEAQMNAESAAFSSSSSAQPHFRFPSQMEAHHSSSFSSPVGGPLGVGGAFSPANATMMIGGGRRHSHNASLHPSSSEMMMPYSPVDNTRAFSSQSSFPSTANGGGGGGEPTHGVVGALRSRSFATATTTVARSARPFVVVVAPSQRLQPPQQFNSDAVSSGGGGTRASSVFDGSSERGDDDYSDVRSLGTVSLGGMHHHHNSVGGSGHSQHTFMTRPASMPSVSRSPSL